MVTASCSGANVIVSCVRISGNTASDKNIKDGVCAQIEKNFAKAKWKVLLTITAVLLTFPYLCEINIMLQLMTVVYKSQPQVHIESAVFCCPLINTPQHLTSCCVAVHLHTIVHHNVLIYILQSWQLATSTIVHTVTRV